MSKVLTYLFLYFSFPRTTFWNYSHCPTYASFSNGKIRKTYTVSTLWNDQLSTSHLSKNSHLPVPHQENGTSRLYWTNRTII